MNNENWISRDTEHFLSSINKTEEKQKNELTNFRKYKKQVRDPL